MTPALEVAVESTAQAQLAREAGADRVELCSALDVGGITPSIGAVTAIVAAEVPAHVLIRCRPGDFVYTDAELDVMIRDVQAIAATGVDGVVLGALTPEGTIDEVATVKLVSAARQVRRSSRLSVTFHRAIDHAVDPVAAAALLGRFDIDRILTSGGRPSVAQGLEDGILHQMVDAAGSVQIMAGGGAVVRDAPALLRAGVAAVHFSARRVNDAAFTREETAVPLSSTPRQVPSRSTDPELVRAMAHALRAE